MLQAVVRPPGIPDAHREEYFSAFPICLLPIAYTKPRSVMAKALHGTCSTAAAPKVTVSGVLEDMSSEQVH